MVYVGASGMGRRRALGATVVTVNQNGTFLGDWSGGGNYGPTQLTGGAGVFQMQNSLTGPGGQDPWWNTPLGVVRIDDAISSLTVNFSQIRGDGIGFNIGFDIRWRPRELLQGTPEEPLPLRSNDRQSSTTTPFPGCWKRASGRSLLQHHHSQCPHLPLALDPQQVDPLSPWASSMRRFRPLDSRLNHASRRPPTSNTQLDGRLRQVEREQHAMNGFGHAFARSK